MTPAFELDDALQALAATPALLRAWLEALPPSWTERRERPGTWCPREIVAHLIEGERTDWTPRVRRILAEGKARPFDPFDRSGHERDAGRSLGELLDELARLRAANVEAIAGLQLRPEDLDREGLHPRLGGVTLRNLLATQVVHDLDHVSQIARILARANSAAVGPWNHPDYLGVLHRLLPRDREG